MWFCVSRLKVSRGHTEEWNAIQGQGNGEFTERQPADKPSGRAALQAGAQTHRVLLLAEQFGTGQEVLVLGVGDDRLWEFPEIELEQRRHCVHVRVAVETQV